MVEREFWLRSYTFLGDSGVRFYLGCGGRGSNAAPRLGSTRRPRSHTLAYLENKKKTYLGFKSTNWRHDIQHKKLWIEWHYAECRNFFIVMPNVIMLSVTMLGVIMLSVIMLSVVLLSVIMLSVAFYILLC